MLHKNCEALPPFDAEYSPLDIWPSRTVPRLDSQGSINPAYYVKKDFDTGKFLVSLKRAVDRTPPKTDKFASVANHYMPKPGACMNPTYPRSFYPLILPCGKCANCVKKAQNRWVLRNYFEFASAACSYFVTLTYDDEYLPPGAVLDKEDYKKFMKRFRMALNAVVGKKVVVRYVYAAEYGSKNTLRPHFHALMFFHKNHISAPDLEPIIEKAWGQGFISCKSIADIGAASRYVTKYIAGKYVPPSVIGGRPAPFFQARANPGIGYYGLMENKTKRRLRKCMLHSDPTKRFVRIGKYKYAPDRYMREKLLTEDERMLLAEESMEEQYDYLRARWSLHLNCPMYRGMVWRNLQCHIASFKKKLVQQYTEKVTKQNQKLMKGSIYGVKTQKEDINSWQVRHRRSPCEERVALSCSGVRGFKSCVA